MTIQWKQQSDNSWDGAVGGIENYFRILKLPSRHYDLVSGNGMKVLFHRKSLQQCKDFAENIINTSGDISSYLIAQDNKNLDTTAKFVKPPMAINILGEIITWSPGKGARPVKDVANALTNAGMDGGLVKDLLPRYAFSRACKKLEADRLIDPCPEHDLGHILAYQFTKKRPVVSHDSTTGTDYTEWSFDTEAILHVDKDKGKVWCKDPELMQKAQDLLDNALEVRTASDITRIVQKLFEKNADLFPIRDQGGVYFVPKDHLAFIDKIEDFLKPIGGNVNRFKIADPDGSGSPSVKDAVAQGIQALIAEHEEAIANFGLSTHSGSLEAEAKKIAATRVKIEAYASYLGDVQADMLKNIDESKEKLAQRVKILTTEKTEWKDSSYSLSFKKAVVETPVAN